MSESSSTLQNESPENGNNSIGGHLQNGSEGPDGMKRIPLACLKCRAKRVKCCGERPTCSSCEKFGTDCIYPEGRRRKRTKKQIEEAEEAERQQRMKMDGSSTASATTVPQKLPSNASVLQSPPQQQQPPALPPSLPSYTSSASTSAPPPVGIPPANTLFNGNTQDNQMGDIFALPNAYTPASQSHDGFADLQKWLNMPTPDTSVNDTNNLLANIPGGFTASPPDFMSLASGSQAPADWLKAFGNGGLAILEGDPTKSEPLELFYYRYNGSTSFNPGINRISLKLQAKGGSGPTTPGAAPAPMPPVLSMSDKTSPRIIQNPSFQYFDANGLPLPDIYNPLLEIWQRECSQYFPSIWASRLRERLETGTMSSFYFNAICAVAARFDPKHQDAPTAACAPFVTKAQELIVPLLHLPAHDVTTALLLLAWASFGQGSESGLWQYSGMCYRMSADLGIHEESEVYESQAHVIRTRVLFWSMYITDRVISFSTGRPATISDEIIEIPLPTDDDMRQDPDILNQEAFVYPQLARLSVIVGKISNALNGRRGRQRTLIHEPENNAHVLAALQTELVEFYRSLPPTLQWSVDNFKLNDANRQGGVFLQLHLWANALLTLTYHPDLTKSAAGIETPMHSSLHRSMKLSLASARLINESLVFADLCSSHSYISGPFVIQPIFVAALAFLHEIKMTSFGFSQTGEANNTNNNRSALPGEAFLSSLDKQSLATLSRALQRIEHYWAGAAYATSVLREREAGLGILNGAAKKEALSLAAISLPDKGLIRRYEITDPKGTPATMTSLRDSIVSQSSSANNNAMSAFTTFNFEDLWNNYSVGEASMTPTDYLEISRLLGGAG